MTSRCFKCGYCSGTNYSDGTCNYIVIEGKRRPCEGDSGGHKCEVWVPRKRGKKINE